MSAELSPTEAARLATAVYAVNSGDELGLEVFLADPLFSKKDAKHMLKADVGGRIIRAAKDSFGLCAMGAGQYQGDGFLVFRGTTTANGKADFLTDGRIGITTSRTSLPVHIGFNHAFNSMLPEIRQFLGAARISGNVHCVGHSLGGAVASLAADWISKSTTQTARLYSFGAPRVGTEMFARSTTRSVRSHRMHRVYHETDPVPMVALYPFMQAPFAEVGHYISSTEPLISGEAHRITKYATSVKAKRWDQLCEKPLQPCTVENAIEQWLRSKSPVDSSSPGFWRWVDAALVYVLKKVAMTAILSLQGAFIGFMTLADKIAMILAKGIELADNISRWVVRLMRKLMQALGMRVAESKEELTRALIRYVLRRVAEKANREARNAIGRLGT